MTIFQAILLGILQGITEFLPISSDGHLALAEMWFGLRIPAEDLLAFDVLLHLGTLVAVIGCYASAWGRLVPALLDPRKAHERRLLLFIIIATVPGVVAGVLLDDVISGVLRSDGIIAICFILTGIVLLLGERLGGEKSASSLTVIRAIIIGCAQALALGPGISRSGMTISAGRAAGLSRREALDFSFLMAVPITAGAIAYVLMKIATGDVSIPPVPVLAAGFLASLLSGLCAVLFLRSFVRLHSLSPFALYLFGLGAWILVHR